MKMCTYFELSSHKYDRYRTNVRRPKVMARQHLSQRKKNHWKTPLKSHCVLLCFFPCHLIIDKRETLKTKTDHQEEIFKSVN